MCNLHVLWWFLLRWQCLRRRNSHGAWWNSRIETNPSPLKNALKHYFFVIYLQNFLRFLSAAMNGNFALSASIPLTDVSSAMLIFPSLFWSNLRKPYGSGWTKMVLRWSLCLVTVLLPSSEYEIVSFVASTNLKINKMPNITVLCGIFFVFFSAKEVKHQTAPKALKKLQTRFFTLFQLSHFSTGDGTRGG